MTHSTLTPLAIIIAGAIVAGVVVYANNDSAVVNHGAPNGGFENTGSSQARNVNPVTEDDHIFGNPDAKVTIVEYSDFECPFCGRLHPTLKQIVAEYPDDVNWVYRHLPLPSHPNAIPAAVASECVAELAGNDAFWSFGDTLFENQRSLHQALYLRTALELGISESDFITCLESDRYRSKVTEDARNAQLSGGSGTPFNIVIDANGNPFPFAGALPYENMRAIIEIALAQ